MDIIVESKRLYIREFKEHDLDVFMEYRNDREWMKYQAFKGKTKEEYSDILLKPFNISEGSQIAIISKYSAEIVGDIFIKQALGSLFLGYTIHPNYSNLGYMKEILTVYIQYLGEMYPNHKIIAETTNENIASIKLLESLQFHCILHTIEGRVFEYNFKGESYEDL